MYTRKEPTYGSAENASLRVGTLGSKHKLFLFHFSIAVSVFSCPLFPLLFASFLSATTTLSSHSQSLSVSSEPLFPMLLASFFLASVCFYAYELVQDDVGEETKAQTNTAEHTGPL